MRKYIATSILLCATALFSLAQDKAALPFTTIDWEQLRIDSVLPYYTEVVPLESDYTNHTYSVSIDYPEYQALTSREEAIAVQYDSLISETIRVETFVGVERGKGMLDVAFIPIIRRGGSYLKLMSAQIVITPHATGKLSTRMKAGKKDRYATTSKLANGRWVKLSITEDGMYQISRKTLQKNGFSNPDNVHLYGYGGHVLPELIKAGTHHDDMVEVPLYYNSKTDAWVFWGNGLVYWNGDTRVRNCFARAGYYFLTEESAPSTMQTVPATTLTPSLELSTTRSHYLHEKEEYAWYSIGRNLFENDNYVNSNSHNYTLYATDPAGNGSVNVVMTAGETTTTVLDVKIDGHEQSSTNIPPKADYTYATSASPKFSVEELGTPSSLVVNLKTTKGNNAHLDYIAYNYDRQLKPANGFIGFSGTNAVATRFNIQGSDLKVIQTGKVGQADALVEGTQNGNTYSINVSDGSQHFVAFSTGATFPEPTVVGEMANQDLHAISAVDMVIVIPASGKLQSEAKRLAEAHLRYDSLRVAVVRADQIYNEFSSGTTDPTAIRLFMKMLYDKAETEEDQPRYLLMMGDAAWDNRMLSTAWRTKSPDDYLVCYESENSFSDTRSYVMEDYFGLLDDGEGSNPVREKTDIGVGRFPVSSASAAKIMVDKCISYMSNQNAGSWKNLVYFLGDDGDENEHMKYADAVAENVCSRYPSMEVHKIMWDSFTRVSSTNHNSYPEAARIIKEQMDKGALVMNYTGHAASYGFSHEYVLLRDDFANTKGTHLPLWVTAACDVMPFDAHTSNIGEEAVLNPKGGALAFYGTTRTVYASQNYSMNRYFMQYLFARSTTGKRERNRIGDAIRLAKKNIITDGRESGYYENKLAYALLGDPALTMGAPLQKVVLDSINDTKVDGQNIQLKAGMHVRLKGHVEDGNGAVIEDFNGIIQTRLYDSKETVTCKNQAGAETAFTYTDRNALLYETQDAVKDGYFDDEFIMPVDINYSNEDGRFVFYAITDDLRIEANGYNEDIPIGGIVESTDFDTDGPTMYVYLNHEDFKNGETVNATPYMVASFQDASGISCSGNGIGHDITLTIDNKASLTYNLNAYYTHDFGDFTKGTAAFTIPQLSNGPHTLTLRAWDVLNNTSSTSLDFVVDDGLTTNILNLTATKNPAITYTDFKVSYDLPGSDIDFIIEVFDFSGRCIWSHEETANSERGNYTITWNLCNNTGGKVGTGIYLYRCQVKCGNSKWTSKTQKIIVKNNK